MTLTSDDIALCSKYTVGTTGSFTTDQLADYEEIAVSRCSLLGADDLDDVLYKNCLALMVCHLHTSKQGIVDIESTTDPSRWKWVKPGDTTYLRQIREIIADFKASEKAGGAPTRISRDSANITHSDSTAAFRVTAGGVRQFQPTED